MVEVNPNAQQVVETQDVPAGDISVETPNVVKTEQPRPSLEQAEMETALRAEKPQTRPEKPDPEQMSAEIGSAHKEKPSRAKEGAQAATNERKEGAVKQTAAAKGTQTKKAVGGTMAMVGALAATFLPGWGAVIGGVVAVVGALLNIFSGGKEQQEAQMMANDQKKQDTAQQERAVKRESGVRKGVAIQRSQQAPGGEEQQKASLAASSTLEGGAQT